VRTARLDSLDVLDDRGFRLAATSNGFVRASGRPMRLNGVFVRAA
jgi:hypothetical protein